ncbi:MAG: hypothetical protein NUW08_00875 [Candidatus Uhrbacteria bacterium]|nr:hypothetical protein [Candidatus Uhrbacteria bacterium]
MNIVPNPNTGKGDAIAKLGRGGFDCRFPMTRSSELNRFGGFDSPSPLHPSTYAVRLPVD